MQRPDRLQSQMEWDEEEAVAPPRSQNKVRQRVREVMYRRVAAAAAAMQQVNRSDVKTPEHGPSAPVNGKRNAGSVRNARNGIERRRKYEVCLPPFTFATPLTSHSSQACELTTNSCYLSPSRHNVRYRKRSILKINSRRLRGPRS